MAETTTTVTVSTLMTLGEGDQQVTVTHEEQRAGARNVRFVVRRGGEVLSMSQFRHVPAEFVTADLAMAFALESAGWLHVVAPLHPVHEKLEGV
jgi:hypothetical protein